MRGSVLATRLKAAALVLWFSALLLAMPAAASTPAAQAAFMRGEFLTAAQLARGQETASGDALAARSTLVYAELLAPEAQRPGLIDLAQADARRAIARDGENPEAHLYLAIALGFRARLEGRMAAHFLGLGKEAHQHIAIAQKLAPDNAWGHAVLGGWNLEICIRGGMLGRSIYHASASRGIAEYEHALALDPQNPSIIFQYAVQLLALNGDSSIAKVSDLLNRLAGEQPADALSRLGLARTRKLASLLASNDRTTLAVYLDDQLDLKNEPLASTDKAD